MGADGFRPWEPGDATILAAHVASGGAPTCDLAPANLRIWRDCEQPSVGRAADAHLIRLEPHHEPPYCLEPLGASDAAAAAEAGLAAAGRLSRVRESFVARLPAGRFDVRPLRDHADYVYDVAALAELRGPAHLRQRNRMRKFLREHPRHEFRAVDAGDAAGALRLFDRWRDGRSDEDRAGSPPHAPSEECQRRALRRAFQEFPDLGLLGGAVTDGGEMLGFLLASRTGDGVVAHFLYAEPGLAGVSQTIPTNCCRGAFAGAAFLDLEEDLGLPGLRQSKLSWQPSRLVPKFEVVRT